MRKNRKSKKILLILILVFIIIISICLLAKKIKHTNTNITIEYILNNQKHTLDDNQVFNNESPISLTWNTNKNAIITLPDKTEKSINKETSFSEVGKYKVKIGKITKEFEIIEESIEQYISFDSSTNTITIKNSNNINSIYKSGIINSITINNEVFSKESNNIPTTYTFNKRGKYIVIVFTLTSKELQKQYTIK